MFCISILHLQHDSLYLPCSAVLAKIVNDHLVDEEFLMHSEKFARD